MAAIPRQQVVDLVDLGLGDVGQHMAQIRLWVDAMQLSGAKEAVEVGGPFAAFVVAGEQPVFLPERQSPVILPISGRKSSSTTGGILCMAARSGGFIASNAPPGSLFT